MSTRPTALTAASGEHFVAFYLSALGYPAALTRAGSPGVDVLVASKSGRRSVSIQVKTANSACRGKSKPCWEWDVGKNAIELNGESIFYAFVDLKSDENNKILPRPDVCIVPSSVVAGHVKPDFTRFRFWMYKEDRDKYLERWDLIAACLED